MSTGKRIPVPNKSVVTTDNVQLSVQQLHLKVARFVELVLDDYDDSVPIN